jgi:hypothetical protein
LLRLLKKERKEKKYFGSLVVKGLEFFESAVRIPDLFLET